MKVIAIVLPLLVHGARILRKQLENATDQEFQVPRCGIVNECQKNWDYLYSIGSRGSIMKKNGMECDDGYSDPCSLQLRGEQADMDKDPSLCVDRAALFLWDEPCTDGGHYGTEAAWRDPKHSAAMWVKYADKFKRQILDRRAGGMKVTSPLFSPYGHSPHNQTGKRCEFGDAKDQLKLFFDHCQDCDNPNSHRYIELIRTRKIVHGLAHRDREVTVPAMKDQVSLIKNETQAVSSQNGNRKVWLTFSCFLCDADKHVATIKSSGMFDFDGVVTAVFYDIYKYYYGDSFWNERGLEDLAPQFGQTIGRALVEKCEGNCTKG